MNMKNLGYVLLIAGLLLVFPTLRLNIVEGYVEPIATYRTYVKIYQIRINNRVGFQAGLQAPNVNYGTCIYDKLSDLTVMVDYIVDEVGEPYCSEPKVFLFLSRDYIVGSGFIRNDVTSCVKEISGQTTILYYPSSLIEPVPEPTVIAVSLPQNVPYLNPPIVSELTDYQEYVVQPDTPNTPIEQDLFATSNQYFSLFSLGVGFSLLSFCLIIVGAWLVLKKQ